MNVRVTGDEITCVIYTILLQFGAIKKRSGNFARPASAVSSAKDYFRNIFKHIMLENVDSNQTEYTNVVNAVPNSDTLEDILVQRFSFDKTSVKI